MADGYLLCLSNPSMPNILKVFASENTPEEVLNEANDFDKWRPPTPYKLELAKKVNEPSRKEMTIYSFIEKHRVENCFHVSLDDVKRLFDTVDGISIYTFDLLGEREISRLEISQVDGRVLTEYVPPISEEDEIKSSAMVKKLADGRLDITYNCILPEEQAILLVFSKTNP